jgi:hypothetical protein
MQPAAPQATVPPITAEHLQRAFEAMHWPGWTFDAAMANDMRRRLVVCRAHLLRTREWLASLPPGPTQCVRRVRLNAQGEVDGWCTQAVMGPRSETPQLTLPLPPT